MRRLFESCALALALAGCGDSEMTDILVDMPADIPAEMSTGACGTDVPQLDWESFGEGFVTTYCQGCHASAAPDRHGAPPQVFFDTEEDALAWQDRILKRAAAAEPTM